MCSTGLQSVSMFSIDKIYNQIVYAVTKEKGEVWVFEVKNAMEKGDEVECKVLGKLGTGWNDGEGVQMVNTKGSLILGKGEEMKVFNTSSTQYLIQNPFYVEYRPNVDVGADEGEILLHEVRSTG